MVTEPHTSTEAAADGVEIAEVAAEMQSKRVKWGLGSFFKKASDGTAALADREAIEVELKSYLTMQVNGETDPLDWWQLYQANYPRVARLAQKYLYPGHKCSFRKGIYIGVLLVQKV